MRWDSLDVNLKSMVAAFNNFKLKQKQSAVLAVLDRFFILPFYNLIITNKIYYRRVRASII